MAPRFIQKPRSTEVVEGESLTVVCEVVGDPKPEVSCNLFHQMIGIEIVLTFDLILSTGHLAA